MFRTNFVQETYTHTLYVQYLFSPDNRAVYEITWKKNGTARQATDDNTAHAFCMPDN
jgi:hypothetical protein